MSIDVSSSLLEKDEPTPAPYVPCEGAVEPSIMAQVPDPE